MWAGTLLTALILAMSCATALATGSGKRPGSPALPKPSAKKTRDTSPTGGMSKFAKGLHNYQITGPLFTYMSTYLYKAIYDGKTECILKIMPVTERGKFNRKASADELRAAESLIRANFHHKNVVDLYTAFKEEAKSGNVEICIVMKYLPPFPKPELLFEKLRGGKTPAFNQGDSLDDVLQHGTLHIDVARRFMHNILDGYMAMLEHGINHDDLGASNVVVTSEKRGHGAVTAADAIAVIVDFDCMEFGAPVARNAILGASLPEDRQFCIANIAFEMFTGLPTNYTDSWFASNYHKKHPSEMAAFLADMYGMSGRKLTAGQLLNHPFLRLRPALSASTTNRRDSRRRQSTRRNGTTQSVS